MLIRPGDSLLLVVDMQVRLAPAVDAADAAVERTRTLLQAARSLAIPVLASEHCAQALGAMLPDLLALAPPGAVVAKTHFSCAAEPAVVDRVRREDRRQLILAGMEAHVCVLQSALGFQELGYEMFVVSDAVGSRQSESKRAGLARLAAAGVGVVTTEMVVFEWLGRADRPEFRSLLALIK